MNNQVAASETKPKIETSDPRLSVACWVRIEGYIKSCIEVLAVPRARKFRDPGLHDGRR